MLTQNDNDLAIARPPQADPDSRENTLMRAVLQLRTISKRLKLSLPPIGRSEAGSMLERIADDLTLIS